MALTPFRWLAAAVAGSLLLFFTVISGFERVAASRPRAVRDSVRSRLESDASTQQIRLWRLATRFRMAQVVDSTRRSSPKATGPDVRAFYDKSLPNEVRRDLESLMDRAVRGMSGPVRAGVDVYFVYDTARAVHGILRNTPYGPTAVFELPTSANLRCGVLVLLEREPPMIRVRAALRTQSAAEQLFGPCAYIRAFGRPGPSVDRWLARGGWSLGTDGSWTRPPSAIWAPQRANKYFAEPSRILSWLEPSIVQCARGNVAVCNAGIVNTSVAPTLTQKDAVITATSRLGPREYWRSPLGVRGGELLAGMVRTLGSDRFERFWTSGDSLPIAFQQAAGEPLSAWIARWMVEQYGVVEAGPAVKWTSVIASLALVALFFSFAVFAYARRQFASTSG